MVIRIALFVALSAMLVLAGCGDSEDNDRNTNETRSATPTAATAADNTPEAGEESTEPVATEPAATATSAEPTATATEASTATPTTPAATPTPEGAADVVVGKYRMYMGQYSTDPRVFGDIVNNGTATATDVQVAVQAYDAAGTILGSGEAIYKRPMIPAGEKSPFLALLNGVDPAAVAELKIQVQFETYDPSSFMADFYSIDIGVTQVQWANDNIVGEVQNNGEKPVSNVSVIVIGYDAAGEPMGVYQTYADLDQLDPGATTSFSASYLGYEGDPATVEAFASGLNQ